MLFLYVATLGVAMAAPFIQPKATSLVCTSTGYKLVGQQGGAEADAGAASHSHLLDCALCLGSGIVPSLTPREVAPAMHALSYILRSIPAARLASITCAPLPARGPPALS